MKSKSRRPLPPIAGADPLQDVLESINQKLAALPAREQAGEDVAGERQELEDLREQTQKAIAAVGQPGGGGGGGADPLAALAAAAGTRTALADPEREELEQLRTREREQHERGLAARAVRDAFGAIEADHRDEQERVKRYALEALQEAAGDGNGALRATIEGMLRGVRGDSRHASEHASPDHLRALASGFPMAKAAGDAAGGQPGNGVTVRDPHSVQVGANREMEAMFEEKSFLKLFSALHAVKEGWADDNQRQFLGYMRSKAMAEGTDTAGGFLIHPEWMEDILPLLRAQAVVLKAGPKRQPFAKIMNQTSVSSGASAAYTLENARIPTSEMTMAEAPLLTPHNLTALVPISIYLLNDASPEAEQMIRDELATVLALRGDLAFLQGTGTGGEPLGFKNMPGATVNPINPGANGVQLTLQTMRRVRAALEEQNTSRLRPVWFWNPKFTTYLSTLQEMSGGSPTGRLLLDSGMFTINDDRRSGEFDGLPWFASNQIPANITLGTGTTTYLELVNMDEAIYGVNQELEVAVSTEASYTTDGGATWHSAFQEGQALFRAIERHDIAHRRQSQVIIQNGVLY